VVRERARHKLSVKRRAFQNLTGPSVGGVHSPKAERSRRRIVGIVANRIRATALQFGHAFAIAGFALLSFASPGSSRPGWATAGLTRAISYRQLAHPPYPDFELTQGSYQTMEDLRRIPAANSKHDMQIDELH
jgi:hypothetical protein